MTSVIGMHQEYIPTKYVNAKWQNEENCDELHRKDD